MQIPGSTFLVSGGASGLGAACVRLLAVAGGNVVIADLNKDAGEALAAELGGRARFARADVTDEAGVRNAVNLAVSSFGALHGAVACAGIAVAERTLGKNGPHPLASFARVITVNLVGTFNLLRLAAEAMARHAANAGGERGVVVMTASVAAFEGQIGQAAYAASKGGVAALTLPAARDLARVGVRVVSVAPGTFDTPLLAGLPEAARQSLAQQVPFPPRLGRPEEFAALVRHVVENEMLNGAVLRLDGALRMGVK
ncbi:MAG TPA: SDR family NAD(P)-dependent oxidoreductase [Gemmataceae bacterium]|nr:SDR family NAD(P)-dependent oxidoreductase [Gemmataceae bacterium]